MAVGAMRLDWGGLDLVSADGGYPTYSLYALGEGADFGEPTPVEVVVATLMGDGNRTDLSRYENREISFRVEVKAADAGGLADGEAALDALVGRRTTLTWQPPDGYGPATVFDVETSRKRFLFSDLDEVRSVKRRTFQITLNCLPFGRSSTPVTIGAQFTSDSVTIADDCESTTGWSVGPFPSVSTTIAVDSSIYATGTGSVRFTQAGSVSSASGGGIGSSMEIIKSGLSVDMSGGGYFVFRVRPEWTLNTIGDQIQLHVTTSGGGRQAVDALISSADANGFLRIAFATPDLTTITGFDFKANQYISGYVGSLARPRVWVDSIGVAANASSAQAAATFPVLGSMRTEASFEVSAAAGLGDVLLYTCPDRGDGFRPDLRRYQTVGSSTSDTAAINGSYTVPGSTGSESVFTAPQGQFRPGAYAVLLRGKRTSAGATVLTVQAQTKIGSTLVGQTRSVVGTFTLPDTTDYYVARVGVIDLPPLVTDAAANATTVFTVTRSGSTLQLDELLVFPLEDASLTWVECGSGAASATSASRFWLDAPSSTLPRGARLKGNDVARLDAQYAPAKSRGRHWLVPGMMFTYLLTSAAGGADLLIRYHPRAHTNNAYDPAA